MRPKPNTVLPKGAKLVKPFRRKIGGWAEQVLDAWVSRHGVTWYRVQHGFGNDVRQPREDWIADLPRACVSVSDYEWNGDFFGPSYGSFENAIIESMKSSLENEQRVRSELAARIVDTTRAIAQLEAAIAAAKS